MSETIGKPKLQAGAARTGFFKLMPAALWIVTTLCAAALGALGTAYIDRPGPGVLIADVNVSTKYNGRFGSQIVAIPQKDALFEELRHDDWMRAIRYSSADLETIVKDLVDDKEKVASVINDMDNFRAVLPELQQELSGPRSQVAAEAFFDHWEPLDSFIYGSIEGEIIRGNWVPPQSQRGDDFQQFLMVEERQTKDGPVHVVSKRGGKFISYFETDKASVQPVAQKLLPDALSYFDQRALDQYLRVAARELNGFSEKQKIEDELLEYIRGYSRWSISLLISNTGNRAISFAPTASFYVDTKGTEVGDDYEVVTLESRGDNGDLLPLTVGGGESKLVTFVSPNPVIGDPRWKKILHLFDSKARNCFVVLQPDSDAWIASKNVKSPVAVFGLSSGGTPLPASEIASVFARR